MYTFPRPWTGVWGPVQPVPFCQAVLAGGDCLPGRQFVQLADLLPHQGHLRPSKGDEGPGMPAGRAPVHGRQTGERKDEHDEPSATHAHHCLHVVAEIQRQTLHDGSLSQGQNVLRW